MNNEIASNHKMLLQTRAHEQDLNCLESIPVNTDKDAHFIV